LLWLVVVMAPPWFVDDDSLEGLKAQNEVRTTLLQGVAGLVLLVGAYFTWRQLHTAREGQITERYTRAIDQLGHGELDVRLGGIYALERIARDSPADRRTIAEVLSAFIRTHAPWPPRLPGQYKETASIDQVPSLPLRAPDVQAALTVLGHGEFERLVEHVPRLDLIGADLRRANLFKANLQQATLANGSVQEANLNEANLHEAYFEETNLQGASLHDANLQGAYLGYANLQGAILHGANLQEAILHSTNLQKADLRGANLQDAELYRARLEQAMADEGTTWPDGFDWRAAGVISEGDEAHQP
jgi:hypothetical protein